MAFVCVPFRRAGLTGCLLVGAAFLFVGLGRLQAAEFIRGDVDSSGNHQITDSVRILGYLFLGSPEKLPCLDAADVTTTVASSSRTRFSCSTISSFWPI